MAKIKITIIFSTVIVFFLSIFALYNVDNLSITKKLNKAKECLSADNKIDNGDKNLYYYDTKNYQKIKCASDFYSNPKDINQLKEMINLLIASSKTDPLLANACHDILHELGKNAYQKYKNKSLFTKYYTCGFGYLHGAMSQSLINNNDNLGQIEILNELCKKLESEVKYTINQCHHGIGHAIGSQDISILQQTNLCQNLSSLNPRDTIDCTSGAYNQYFIDRTLENSGNIKKSLSLCDLPNDINLLECYKFALMYTNLPSQKVKEYCLSAIDQSTIYKYYGCIRSIGMLAVHNELSITNSTLERDILPIIDKFNKTCQNININEKNNLLIEDSDKERAASIREYMSKNPCHNQFFSELFMKLGNLKTYQKFCDKLDLKAKKECEDIIFKGKTVYDITSAR